MADDYIAFCERCLWKPWKAQGHLEAPRPFNRYAMPEPYLYFHAGKKPLVAFTTNPGATMCHQRRAAVKAGNGPVREADRYDDAAWKLGCFYWRKLAGRAAGRRIDSLLKLSYRLHCDGVLQVELFPFHSQSLPKKTKNVLLHEIRTDREGLLGRYVEHLRKFLQGRPVIVLQASNGPETAKSDPWLTWIAELAGLDLDATKLVALVKRDSKTTAAAWVSKSAVRRKALVLRMGMNDLPGDEGLTRLTQAVRKLWNYDSGSFQI